MFNHETRHLLVLLIDFTNYVLQLYNLTDQITIIHNVYLIKIKWRISNSNFWPKFELQDID